MVRKKTLVLSLVIAALLVSIIHVNPEGESHYADSPLLISSLGEITGLSLGTFTTGILIEYSIFLVAIYLLLRGISKRFGR
ncbi:MAG: hypothetical protein GTN37_02630 [Candidatus Aenigmarchaeota archaeon]|nr:hypothetical protein [Candidatus Aenigmarchaeota archaeon]NIQ17879.1 hypothetical protein [Candidatus Aenigmarchaeota archaeon]NIS73299.1 hypothetical protein [Candidatus Aenigmarchaeota archaeon]